MTVPSTSSSVVRAFDLLELIAAVEPRGATLAEIDAQVPMAKSSTLRYLTTLVELDAVRREPDGRFRLGLKMVELAGGLLENDDLRSVAEPVLHELAEVSGETVHLGVRSGAEVVYIAKVESRHSVRLVSRIGARTPVHCSAMGKALLAALDPSDREPLLSPLPRRTPHTITTAAEMRDELEAIRSSGFSLDDEENELGVRCVGAAVLGTGGEPLGAISVSGPAARLDRERAAELGTSVIETAAEITRQLGFRSSADAAASSPQAQEVG
jgi:DNA-binding IclR family transcriptional regulator